ncbi:MAG: P-type conjugative transfer protein TrbL [Alphaproteobacteria bacterium]|nr:P-type conjugative transfer protein TrbL [Alphaproteobacteria bacterium]
MMRPATAATWRITLPTRTQWAVAAGLTLLLAVAVSAHAAPAPTPTGGPGGQGYLDTISSQFQAATTGWMTTAQGYAFKIFTALAAMDLSWWGIKQVLKKNDLADFIAGATLKIASIAFFYTIVKYAPTWMPLITSSFMDMGQAIGGSSAATASPSGVMSMAFSVVHQLYEVYNKAPGGLLNIGSNLFLAIIIAITSLLALIGFGLVALQLLMTLIETYLVGGAGLVMLGFTGSGLTSSFGEKYIGYLVSVGIKLLMIYAIIGLGQNLINSELAYIAQYTGKSLPPTDLLTVGVSMLIYGVIGMQAPGLAGSLMNGSPNMSLGNVAGGAAAIAGGMAAAGAAGVAAYASGAKGLDKMAGLLGAGSGGGASGAGGAIAGAEKLAALGQMTGSGGKPAGGMMGSIGGGAKGGGASTSAPTSGTPAGSLAGAGSVGANTARMGQAAQAMMEGKGISGPSSTPLRPSATPAPAQPSPAPSAPPKGPIDALGAPSGESGRTDLDKPPGKSDRDPFDVLKDNVGKVADTKDDIARHEGGGGSGIQIRLGHVEH